jgi:hypothetical protein
MNPEDLVVIEVVNHDGTIRVWQHA